jgi:hypothetical protein
MRKERSYALFKACIILLFRVVLRFSPRVMWAMVGEPGLEPGTSVLSGLGHYTLCYTHTSSTRIG